MDSRLVAIIMSFTVWLTACQPGGAMSSAEPITVDDDLAAVLAEYRPFLLSDDDERSDHIANSESDTLRALAEAVEPLFDEINATLDKTGVAPSLTEDEQALESDLHSLAQAAMEARIELDERGE